MTDNPASEIARLLMWARSSSGYCNYPEVQAAMNALEAEVERLTAQLAKCREATVEECAKVADSFAGTPVSNPERPIDWAEHGERMSALRIGKKIRALTTGERQ